GPISTTLARCETLCRPGWCPAGAAVRGPLSREGVCVMSKLSVKLLFVVLGLAAVDPARAEQPKGGKGVALEMGKVEESEAKSALDAPQFGYVGSLGSFVASKGPEAEALLVVHQYPDTARAALGRSKLTYEGTKRLGNVDG